VTRRLLALEPCAPDEHERRSHEESDPHHDRDEHRSSVPRTRNPKRMLMPAGDRTMPMSVLLPTPAAEGKVSDVEDDKESDAGTDAQQN